VRRTTNVTPYGETSILTIKNMLEKEEELIPNSKFQLIARVKAHDDSQITLQDEFEELTINFDSTSINASNLDVIILFGEISASQIKVERILPTTLDWDLYLKTKQTEL